ncbi:hypothetical protein [Butyrivibrio sp. AE3004]|uniref:hypothetical protein n=1 Tax=Butyrivibrio sp. AE3004 TaxID=1506994 RepID=UPI000493D363|nr:hypothetical protein [Butyrivibrio sp. AE3004]
MNDHEKKITVPDEKIKELIDSAIVMCDKMANIELNAHDRASLSKLDNVIEQIKGLKKKNIVTEEVARNIAVPFGVLAGEIMLNDRLRSEGFSFISAINATVSDAGAPIVIADKSRINTIDTISMIYKVLTDDGDSKSTLNQFYEAFTLMLKIM